MKSIDSGARWCFKPAAFILVLLVLCSFAAMFVQSHASPKPVPPSPGRAALRKATLDSRASWYFESGQWRSDVHTLVNLLAYLVSPDPAPVTNQHPVHVEAQADVVSPVPTQS